MGYRYYVSICHDTGRVFICEDQKDDNLCEVFAHAGKSAEENARLVADALNVFTQMEGK